MFNIKKHSNFFTKSFILSFGLTLAACGGGGDSGTSYPDIGYSGVTTAATLDETNAADFPIAMLEGSTSSSQANPYAVVTDSDSTKDAQHTAMLSIIADQVKNTIINNQIGSSSNIVAGATETINGTCPSNPGSATITDNSTATNLNASVTYNNYCVGDIASSGFELTLYGEINFTGTATQASPLIIQSVTISIPYLKMTVRTTTETVSEEFAGSMTITFDGTEFNNVETISVTTTFRSNGLVYKIENLTIDNTTGLAISGRIYHPTHGYVDITTTTPFTLVPGSNPEQYCGGTLHVEGSGGVADFTADSTCSTYQICFTPTGEAQTCKTGQVWP